MHGSQGGGGRKFNDQSDTHNRRTYDMMNQNSGNQVSHQFLFLLLIFITKNELSHAFNIYYA